MPDVHVSCTLDEEQQICRYLSFVDFVDLLKFGQIRFEKTSRHEIFCPTRSASAWQHLARCVRTDSVRDTPGSTKNLSEKDRATLKLQQGSLLIQSWTLIDEAEPRYWRGCQHPEQCVGVVSNVRSLAESFLVPDDTDLIIAEANGRALLHGCSSTPPAVSVFVNALHAPRASCPESRINLHVVLSTLLSEVIVAPNAPNRFIELVTKLVRENTLATVTRAGQPPLESPRMPSLNRPGFCRGSNV